MISSQVNETAAYKAGTARTWLYAATRNLQSKTAAYTFIT